MSAATTPTARASASTASRSPGAASVRMTASASAAPSPTVAERPRYLKENPKCAVPAGYPEWSWRRVHRVEGLEEKAVILTLDVGAKLPNLVKVLDILRDHKVKTTIFLYTGELEKSPIGRDVVKRMLLDGHELGNHTLSHKDLTKLEDKEAVGEQLDRTESFVKSADASATTLPFFREPYLATNDDVDAIVRERCYRSIWFTVDTGDWRDDATADGIVARVFERGGGKKRVIESGSIFIFHGSQEKNLVALPQVIQGLRNDGYDFLTLGEALRRAKPPAKPAAPH